MGRSEGMEVPEFAPGMGEFPFATGGDKKFKQSLSQAEFTVLRRGGTEAPGRGQFCDFFPGKGYFACKACKLPLYSGTSKFQDCGWDAYDKCFFTSDRCHVTGQGPKHHMEAVCSGCGSHLGHTFFGEGPTETNERH